MLTIKIFMAIMATASADLMLMEDNNKSIAHQNNMVAIKFQVTSRIKPENLTIEGLSKKIPDHM
jgi:hypothetical protein